MREIKFRAWDNRTNEILKEDSLKYLPGSSMMTVNAIFADKDYIWMQYTGLKSKSGVEIFEGDIVKRDGYESRYGRYVMDGIVKFEKTGFVVDVYEPKWSKEMTPFSFFFQGEMNWEVIGNVFEHPELLESDKN